MKFMTLVVEVTNAFLKRGLIGVLRDGVHDFLYDVGELI